MTRLAGPSVLAVALVALVLRGPVASVGPVLDELRGAEGLSTATVAVLTGLPLLCFGAVAAVAPLAARRLGLHGAVLAGLLAVATGVGLRLAGLPGLFLGTALLGAGIAVVNVLLPAVVKADFGSRAVRTGGVVTGGVVLSAAAGAGLAQPLLALTGGALSSLTLWLLPAALALALWLPRALAVERGAPPERPPRVLAVLRDPTARAVTAYFGLQSLVFYALLAWLPQLLRDAGVSPTTAGVMVAVMTVLGVPVALLLPRRAATRPDQRREVGAAAAATAVGLLGLALVAETVPWLWVLLVGVGTGAAFPLALTLVLQRTADAGQTARLSAAAQCLAYLVAATGPVAVGVLHDVAGGWGVPMALLLVLLAGQTVAGLRAATPGTVQA